MMNIVLDYVKMCIISQLVKLTVPQLFSNFTQFPVVQESLKWDNIDSSLYIHTHSYTVKRHSFHIIHPLLQTFNVSSFTLCIFDFFGEIKKISNPSVECHTYLSLILVVVHVENI